MQAVIDYLKQNESRSVNELCEYLRFPSVSAQSKHREDMAACARWLIERCQRIGLETKLCPTEGAPVKIGGPAVRLTIFVGEDDIWHHKPLYHEIVHRAHAAVRSEQWMDPGTLHRPGTFAAPPAPSRAPAPPARRIPSGNLGPVTSNEASPSCLWICPT